MVSSYLADTEVYLVWHWKKGAGAYDFHALGNYLVICPLPQIPSIPRSKTQQKQDAKSYHAHLRLQKPVFCTHALRWRLQIAAKVGREAVSRAQRAFLSETRNLCTLWSIITISEKEVDSEVKWLSL